MEMKRIYTYIRTRSHSQNLEAATETPRPRHSPKENFLTITKKKPNRFDNNQKLRQKVEIEFEKLLD